VREVRNGGRLLIDVQGRAMVVAEADVMALPPGAQRSKKSSSVGKPDTPASGAGRPREIDLHGLTVEEALERVDSALNEALLADAESLRLIHGRSGGKIRAALHRRLREMPGIRGFRIDPRNEGVTIVSF